MSGTDFNLATSILFVGYLLMQLPSNLLLTRVRPSLFLGIAMGIWGVISACQAATQSFAGLVVARFFLGFVEAPFFPGAVMLMYVSIPSLYTGEVWRTIRALTIAGRAGTPGRN
jgi:MFS family permease